MSRYYPGPDCATCGLKAINVVHDDPDTRARNIATWAGPSREQGWQDYYTWAGVEYHPFAPTYGRVPTMPYRTNAATTPDCRSEYDRGYQAGYRAGLRRAVTGRDGRRLVPLTAAETGTGG